MGVAAVTLISERLLLMQELDQRIAGARRKRRDLDESLDLADREVEGLEEKTGAVEKRLAQVLAEERRLNRAVDARRDRIRELRDRLKLVREPRQYEAVMTEMEFLVEAVDDDETEQIKTLDAIARFEEQRDELKAELEAARESAAPRRFMVEKERDEASSRIAELRDRRDKLADGIEDRYRRIYESINRDGERQAVWRMTSDGACGSCFSMIPLQARNELRRASTLFLCEGCGVIVTTPEAGAPK